MKQNLIKLVLVFLLSSKLLVAQKFIKLDPTPNSFTSKKPISSVYQSKNEINVVLRNSSYDFTNENDNSNSYTSNLLFNTIEKEFIKYGLNVKDAALYKMDKNTTDNNVDIMIDLAVVEVIKYHTNYFIKKHDGKTSDDIESLTLNGYKYDFRIVDPRSNEVLGYYTFNFTPCTQGCQITIHRAGKNYVEFVKKKYAKYKGAWQSQATEDEDYIDFCKLVATSLIKVLKKNTTVESIVDESSELYAKAKKDVYKYFPVSYFLNNTDEGLINKNKKIYVTSYTYGGAGEEISPEVKSGLIDKGYEVTDEVSQAGYFLFVFKGRMTKTGPDRNCIQFQFIDAKSLKKLSGASYKYRKNEYVNGLSGYVELFVNSL
ncbi:MAG TPA: hypothetical protein PLO52_03390 [Flavobacterium alvei]|nr:hypothetical protein [Flavobacterium alvei]